MVPLGSKRSHCSHLRRIPRSFRAAMLVARAHSSSLDATGRAGLCFRCLQTDRAILREIDDQIAKGRKHVRRE